MEPDEIMARAEELQAINEAIVPFCEGKKDYEIDYEALAWAVSEHLNKRADELAALMQDNIHA